MYVTITLNDQLQKDQKNPVELIIKNSRIDVICGLVYVTLAENINSEEEINNFLHRQLKLQKRMADLLESATHIIQGLSYSFEVCGPVDGSGIEEAYLLLEPTVFDVEMEEELMEGEAI